MIGCRDAVMRLRHMYVNRADRAARGPAVWRALAGVARVCESSGRPGRAAEPTCGPVAGRTPVAPESLPCRHADRCTQVQREGAALVSG